MSEAREYYDSLIAQGYLANQALSYTHQHFPEFQIAVSDSIGTQHQYQNNQQNTMMLQYPNQPPTQSLSPHGTQIPQGHPPTYAAQPTQTSAHIQPIIVGKEEGKTFYSPLITIGIIILCMFMPYLTFEHEELTNSEEKDACEFIYMEIQASTNADSNVETDDLECPMNGFTATTYSVDTISSFETDDFKDESDSADSDSSSEEDDELFFFALAFLMLLASPFIYIIVVAGSIISVVLKKYPIALGIIQLLYICLLLTFSLMGEIDTGTTISVHSNLAGIGVFFSGFAAIGLLIPK